MNNNIKNEAFLRILSLEDSFLEFENIREKLIEAGFGLNTFLVENEKDYRLALQNNTYDIILADLKLSNFDAFKALKICKEVCPQTPFICISAAIDEKSVLELIKKGATDYVLKDNLVRLPFAVQQAIDKAKEIESNKQLSDELEFSEQIFNSFMEHSPIYVFFKDSTIRAIRLSKNYETMLGKPMHELIGKNMEDLFPSELAKSMVADDMKILTEGIVVTIEEEFNGRFYSTIKFPIHIDGKAKFLAGYTIDITESKQNEKLLNEKMEEMLNFHRLTVGRELIMIELKKEINLLLKELGRDEKYRIVN